MDKTNQLRNDFAKVEGSSGRIFKPYLRTRTERPEDRLETEMEISGFFRKSRDILRAYLEIPNYYFTKLELATLSGCQNKDGI